MSPVVLHLIHTVVPWVGGVGLAWLVLFTLIFTAPEDRGFDQVVRSLAKSTVISVAIVAAIAASCSLERSCPHSDIVKLVQ